MLLEFEVDAECRVVLTFLNGMKLVVTQPNFTLFPSCQTPSMTPRKALEVSPVLVFNASRQKNISTGLTNHDLGNWAVRAVEQRHSPSASSNLTAPTDLGSGLLHHHSRLGYGLRRSVAKITGQVPRPV